MDRYAIILAAGKGTRMKLKDENTSKVSIEIFGKPIVRYVIDALETSNLKTKVCVVGHAGEHTKQLVEDVCEVVWQKEQKGTGHAVMQATEILKDKEGSTIILCGDTPLLRSETISKALEYHEKNNNDLTILSSILENPFGYGRIVKKDGLVTKIVEEKDANDDEKKIKEINTGVLIFNNKKLFEYLPHLSNQNAKNEYYLTDLIEMFVKDSLKVASHPIEDANETLGINDREQLAEATEIMKQRINR